VRPSATRDCGGFYGTYSTYLLNSLESDMANSAPLLAGLDASVSLTDAGGNFAGGTLTVASHGATFSVRRPDAAAVPTASR
jgi:hypothetical protein